MIIDSISRVRGAGDFKTQRQSRISKSYRVLSTPLSFGLDISVVKVTTMKLDLIR